MIAANSNFIKTCFLLLFLLISFDSYGACCSTQSGTVNSTSTLNNGIFFFSLTGPTSNKPACNTSSRLALNINNANQKAMMAVILSAQASNSQVQVVGLGACTTWPDSDDAATLNVH